MAIDPADRKKFEEKAVSLGVEYYIIGTFLEDPKGKIIL
jgi:hypothetical protein